MIISNPKINLAEYLEDAQETKTILVGLENITELFDSVKEKNVPYYHCNQEDCYNEQGKARQIYKHLNSYSHKQAWIKQTKDIKLVTREDINDWLKNNHVDQQSYKTITNNLMWDECRQSLLRAQNIFEHFKDAHINSNQIQTKSSELQMESQISLTTPEVNSSQIVQSESSTKSPTATVTAEKHISENLSATTLSASEISPPHQNQGLVQFSISVDELLGDKSDSEAMNSDDNSPFPNTQFSDSAFGQSVAESQQTIQNVQSHTDFVAPREQQEILNIQGIPRVINTVTDGTQSIASSETLSMANKQPPEQPRVVKRKPFPKPIILKVEPEPTVVKNEVVKNEIERPKDLLQTPIQVKKIKTTVELEYQYRLYVKENVDWELQKYYLDKNPKLQNPKILTQSEFEEICKHLSRHLREEIRKSWICSNGDGDESKIATPTLERNEIMNYGLEFHIEQYFDSDHYKDVVQKRYKDIFK